jgi:hypothetical protein
LDSVLDDWRLVFSVSMVFYFAGAVVLMKEKGDYICIITGIQNSRNINVL